MNCETEEEFCESRESLGQNWPTHREFSLWNYYHITKEQYMYLHILQKGLCKTCKNPASHKCNQHGRFLCVDHM